AVTLPGPTGERNVYSLAPRSSVLCLASSDADRLVQLAAVLAAGSRAIWPADAQSLRQRLPSEVQAHVAIARDWGADAVSFDAVLLHGSVDDLASIQKRLAQREGPVVSVERMEAGESAIPMERLVVERALSINTAAAGGNASLMTVG
ncbi:MAG TPA: trifunctional transcriptional regulator/proline dehydrogenase/L-glutamate gamma-semialdehyde dehydrogenase, partial [Burkholderiaceae bacterium]|nr:trifunctional transcriptional regulator/proline dehydrogenase/L-glutamate gamma-semialdehyde dehydrogenase [Burkholderiaceae bacterium]